MLVHVGRRWWLASVWVGRRWSLTPFMRAGKTVELLLGLVVMMGGHVGTRVPRWLSRGRRERGGELLGREAVSGSL